MNGFRLLEDQGVHRMDLRKTGTYGIRGKLIMMEIELPQTTGKVLSGVLIAIFSGY